MADNRYIGITIGPIFDVMNLSSTPASLWASSYMFSFLSKTICDELVSRGIEPKDIIAPYYEPGNEIIEEMAKEGVGLFHDHIIFRQKDFDIETMKAVRAAALDRLSGCFDIDREYLDKFVMIASVEFEADYTDTSNPLFASSLMFDSLELSKQFVPVEDHNPILAKFTGRDQENQNSGKNELIKRIATVNLGCAKWQMLKENGSGALKSLGDINSEKYYAIVRADGDDMGKYIATLGSDEEVRLFSQDCFTYCRDVAAKVKAFGGVTIYAGGDDLLAIMPCVSDDGSRTILDFVKKAQSCFGHKLSFGITICHYKFPLYEAVSDSAELLYGTAKSRYVGGKPKKHNTVIRIQKHAGQSEGFIIGNDTIDALLERQHSVISAKTLDKNEVFLSALHKISLFREMLDIAAMPENSSSIQPLFDNIFDAHDQDTAFLHRELPGIYRDIVEGNIDITAIGEDERYGAADTLSYLLRMFKFFLERDARQ